MLGRFDEFEGHLAFYGFMLFGQPDGAHASLAWFHEELIAANPHGVARGRTMGREEAEGPRWYLGHSTGGAGRICHVEFVATTSHFCFRHRCRTGCRSNLPVDAACPSF
jgi:hypothetical protein